MIDDLMAQLSRVRGVGGALLLTADGQVVSGILRQDVDDARLAAAVATAIGNVQRLAQTLRLGPPTAVDLTSAQGAVIAAPVGSSWLAVAVDPGANLALLRLEIRPLVEKLAAALSL